MQLSETEQRGSQRPAVFALRGHLHTQKVTVNARLVLPQPPVSSAQGQLTRSILAVTTCA